MGIPDHLTCFLRNLHAGQEATVRTRHETMNWFKIGKGVGQVYILSPWLFNLYSEYHVKWQAGWIKGWNQDCWEKYKQLQIRRWFCSNSRKRRGIKEPRWSWKSRVIKAGLKFSLQITKIIGSGPITSWQIDG